MDEAEKARRGLGTARWIMFAQAVLSLLLWGVQVVAFADQAGRGREVPGWIWPLAVVDLVVIGLTALAAVYLRSRSWARRLGVGVEGVRAGISLIPMITGGVQAVGAAVLAVVVIMLILRYDRVFPAPGAPEAETPDHDWPPPRGT
ncbi:hypothetical protein [Spongiactinospora sp. 9N601]|uniref:hypothetical protein n=1 Tax=Spongiactinospora sp. 9N601 TaxID=3375149 RepID=UPI0037B7ED77